MGGVRSGRGIFEHACEIFEPDRKLLLAPSNVEKFIALAFLKAA
jgi:hypothetical protein